MQDYLLISFMEFIGFLFFWTKVVEKTTDWGHKPLQRDNPHLRICFYSRKWITPAMFLVLSCIVITIGIERAGETVEIVLLNLLVVMSTLLIGPLLSQAVVDHYAKGRNHFFN